MHVRVLLRAQKDVEGCRDVATLDDQVLGPAFLLDDRLLELAHALKATHLSEKG
jgi:hypothetical protein